MARTKKSEEVVEDIQSTTEEVVSESVAEVSADTVEEKPKAKRGRKAKVEEPIEEVPVVEKPVAETPVVEEVPVVAPIVEEVIAAPVVDEVKEEIKEEVPVIVEKLAKKVKAEKPVKKTEVTGAYVGRVTIPRLQSRKGPGFAYPVARDLSKGAYVHISEVDGNWGKISQNTWININFIEEV